MRHPDPMREFLRRQTIRENANVALNALIALVLIVLLLRVTG